jgi:hypothetical protein
LEYDTINDHVENDKLESLLQLLFKDNGKEALLRYTNLRDKKVILNGSVVPFERLHILDKASAVSFNPYVKDRHGVLYSQS